MSHFAVLVVGENVDEQLAPYHEFESTGENDQYVVDVDKTEEARLDQSGNDKTYVCAMHYDWWVAHWKKIEEE